ncbi:MAG: hypothetical protein V7L14_30775 [Nostoc sp.]|uniref:hypothetical protein n=1 Tax=Nostoc sp. TaxID=1180 RepID=UPI002FFC5649
MKTLVLGIKPSLKKDAQVTTYRVMIPETKRSQKTLVVCPYCDRLQYICIKFNNGDRLF